MVERSLERATEGDEFRNNAWGREGMKKREQINDEILSFIEVGLNPL